MMYRKKLSIVIPYHNEAESLIEPLFKSINNQINIDFNDIEILVCNNCDIPIKPKILDKYSKLNINYIHCPVKNNVGMSRQFAIDNCTGQWLLMCDADDSLYAPTTLSTIFSDVDKYGEYTDEIIYNEKIEIEPNNFIDYGKNLVLIHGKLYKVDYLKINNIRFHPSVYYGADIYFNLVLDCSAPSKMILNTPIYIWKKNFSSESNSTNYMDRDETDSVKKVYLAYARAKKYYNPDVFHYVMPDICCAFLINFESIQKWEQLGKTELVEFNKKILAAFIQELDPDYECLNFDYGERYCSDEFKEFVLNSKLIYENTDKSFFEENELWV